MATQNTPDFKGSNSSNMQGQQSSSGASGIMNGLNSQLTNFGNAASGQLGKMSTTQKVVGGLALAAGISWLSKAMNKRNG